jgi:co-chaperonin GroES (HSP10)
MNKVALTKIRKLLATLDNESTNLLIPMIKDHRTFLNHLAKTQFKIGDKVLFKNHTGIIKKLNRTKAVCETSEGLWNVPMTMLEVL